MNAIDPSGTAKCGSLDGDECAKGLRAADQARADSLTAAQALEDLAERVAESNGEDLSSDDQAAIEAVSEKFGSAYDGAKGLRELGSALRKIAGRIGPRGYGALLNKGESGTSNNGTVVTGYIIPGQNYSIYLTNEGLGRSDAKLGKTILHESAHLTVARTMMEWYGKDQISSGVKRGFPMQENADSYACLVSPSVCGY